MSDSELLISPKQLLVSVGLVTLVIFILAATTSTSAFGVYNAAWDGTSELQDVAEGTGATSTIAHETTTYSEAKPNQTIGIILSPDRSYTARERERIETFVRNGGTLVVAGDYGPHVNALLRKIGAEARLDGRPLRDEQVYYRSPAMPIARNVTDHPMMAGVPSVTLNHGTAVEPRNASVLIQTSAYAYADTNQNGSLDANETVASYPVVTTEQLGQGTLVVAGDPSMFINAMLERSGNRDFVRALVAPYSHVILDYSHTVRLPPLAIATLLVRESPLLQFFGGALGTLSIFLGLHVNALARLQKRVTATPAQQSVDVGDAELITHLRDRYPEWDDERIHRIVAARRDPSRETFED